MRLSLVLLIVSSCSFEDKSNTSRHNQLTATSNIEGERIDPWTVSTSEDETIDTYFINRRAGYPSDCVVIDASQQLLDKVDAMITANDDDHKQARKQYQDTLATSDILCDAKYHNGRVSNNGEKEYRYYQSFYNGTASDRAKRNSYQVTCFTKQGTTNYVCRDIVFGSYNDGNDFIVVEDEKSAGSEGINNEISKLDYYATMSYDDNKKMLRVPVSDLRAKWREISPERSQEIPEYLLMRLKPLGGYTEVWMQNIKRSRYKQNISTGSYIQRNILPICNTTAVGVDNDRRNQGIQEGDPNGDNKQLVSHFRRQPVCEDLFLNPYDDNCSEELKTKEIEVCKLNGRGILIKRGESDILRVTNCEYQPHAKHFYCSGKEPGSTKPPQIYFERYGVFVEMRDMPISDCQVKLIHRTDSIGCGKCPPDYDIAKPLAERGCDYNTPHYCDLFSEVESTLYYRIIERPFRCNLPKTCVFRKAGSRWDTPYCHSTFDQQLNEMGCSIKTDNDPCHFKKLSEL